MAKITTQIPSTSNGLHNDLNGLNVGDYQHLTQSEKDNLEYITNKQNNLNPDSTNNKYPTVNAVILGDLNTLNSANEYTDNKLSSVYKYKGSVANYASLPTIGNEIGDVWNVLDTDINYAWTGTEWDSLGGTIDVTGKEDKSNKQDSLVLDGTGQKYPTVDAVNANLELKLDKGSYTGDAGDLKAEIDAIFIPNQLISAVPPTRSVNTFTYPALGYQVLINKTIGTNNSAFITNISVATTNYKRVDLIYFKPDNTLDKIVGTEDLIIAQRPDVPVGSVGISFINVFGNIIEDPVPITNEISIQDFFGVERFKIIDYMRFKNVSFDEAAKAIIIDGLVPLSAFLDPITGNDANAVLENANKPFKTFKALQEALPPYAGETYTIYITGGTIPITRQIVNRNFNWVAYTPVTLDFTNCMLADGTTHATNCLTLANYGSAATWDFRNSNISIVCNHIGIKYMSYVNNNSTTRMLGNINVLDWRSPSTTNVKPCFYFAGNSELIFNKIYNSPQDAVFPIGGMGTSKILVREYIVQYNNRGLFFSENTNYLTVDKITQVGTTTLTFVYGIANIYTEFTIGDINFNVPSTFFPKAGTLICKGKFNANVLINLRYTGIISGTLDSVNYPKNSFCNERQEFRNYNGKLEELLLFGVSALLVITNSNITTSGILARNNNYLNDGKTLVEFNGFNSISQIDTTKALFYSKYDDINQETITNIVDNGQVVTNAKTFGVRTNYNKINATFKEKMNEIVIRSKIDLINKVLSSSVTYVIDGDIILLSGEYIIVPSGGLTINGYGFTPSSIRKNTIGQSIFTSPIGGSGDLITINISYYPGQGSVFNIKDADGTHALEFDKVNFQGVSGSSIGLWDGYRQFTGTTCGFYNLSDGITLDGSWSGFKLINSNIIGFGSTGILFKKGTSLIFSNRFYADLNLQIATGAIICDFQDSNFTNNKALQIVNCFTKVGGVVPDNISTPNVTAVTALTFPNISPYNPKCDFVNNNGIKNTHETINDSMVFTLDGVQNVFDIIHILGVIPKSFQLTFSDEANTDFIQSSRIPDASKIRITCNNVPAAGTITVYYSVST